MLQNYIYREIAEVQINKGATFHLHDVQCSNGPPLKSSMEDVSVQLAFYTKGHKPLMADLMSVLVATFPFCVRNKSLSSKGAWKKHLPVPGHWLWNSHRRTKKLTALFQVCTISGGILAISFKTHYMHNAGKCQGIFGGGKNIFLYLSKPLFDWQCWMRMRARLGMGREQARYFPTSDPSYFFLCSANLAEWELLQSIPTCLQEAKQG